MMGLVLLSLLKYIAHCFLWRLTWCLIGRIEASISRASVGVVQNAGMLHILVSVHIFELFPGVLFGIGVQSTRLGMHRGFWVIHM